MNAYPRGLQPRPQAGAWGEFVCTIDDPGTMIPPAAGSQADNSFQRDMRVHMLRIEAKLDNVAEFMKRGSSSMAKASSCDTMPDDAFHTQRQGTPPGCKRQQVTLPCACHDDAEEDKA